MDENQFSPFSTPLSPIRLQAQLGKETKRMIQEGKNIVRLSLARVVKVNYKYNTVDVITTLNNNSTVKNPNDNGRFSARLPVSFGGKTPDGNIYGANTLVTVGSLVLIGYMEGNKDYPIVLNIYGDADNQSQLTRTSFTSADESDEALQRELWQLFTLYPSMTYKNVDGNGNQEVTFSGKSFLYVTDTDQDNAYVQDAGFNYEDLPSSRYANGELIEPKSPYSPTLLYVHQGIYDKHRVTFFIKSDGTVRLGSKHTSGEGVTFFEMTTDGGFQVVQQKGTANPEETPEKFSKVGILEDGTVVMKSQKHVMEVNNDGVYIDGKAISAFVGGGSVPDGNGGTITLEDVVDSLKDVKTTITIQNGKIESKVGRTEYKIDLDAVKDYSKELFDGVSAEVDDINKSLENLDDLLDESFKDGIIEESEARSIGMYINNLNTQKSELDAKYNQIYTNKYLTGDPKTNLDNAKKDFDLKHQALIDVIQGAIVDGKITTEDREAINNAFDAYHKCVSTLSSAFEAATDAIALAMAKEAEDNAKDFVNGEIKKVNSTITQLADSISSKVESETFTETIKNVNSRIAETEESVSDTNKRVEEVEKKLPYACQIISTDGVAFQGGTYSTTLFAKITKGDQDITSSIDAKILRWTRISNDAAADEEWNKTHGIGVKSITVTNADVRARATFQCTFDTDDLGGG
ncbi:glycerophosphoryl diester phosphodiesterase [Bacillus phage vB_BsuM-Goe3]|uniref:Tail fiber protein n=1 Tax=Bacillus phage vB_BsuM-Goe3 TaxID=1933063 RepID=A0A217ER38_BPGO3|nr:glycerophosphoryl diester phosphodiesterase [Bacillus phage vB_BsuM-Goe3]APZ82547.1 hypothetical protein Goe3_c08600 [Bacillus phage vB_BsuM-Goe3]